MEKASGYVAMLDIYGFSSVISKIGAAPVHTKLDECYSHIQNEILYDILAKQPKTDVYMYAFSDSIFLLYIHTNNKTKTNLLRELVHDTREIMGIFANADLPLRGAISYGDVSYSKNLLIGTPVIDAYRYEQLVPAPIVLLPHYEMKDIFSPDDISQQSMTIILKDGTPTSGMLIYPHPLQSFIDLIEQKCAMYLQAPPPSPPAKAWLQAKQYLKTYLERIHHE